jgi:alpha-N-acetylglucosamine transferase
MNTKNPYSKAGESRLSANIKKILALICFFSFVHLARHTSVIPPSNIEDEDSIHEINVQSTIDTHHCINEDFHHVHKTSVWTMLNDNPSYVLSALKLGRALKKHTKDTDFDLVVMTLESKPLSDKSMKQLAEVGFINCVIKPIRPTHLEGKTRNDLQEKFGVLHVFAMTVYDTVLFLDADTFVQGPLDDLLKMDIKGKKIGVTKDIRARKWVDTFNTGVMLLHPSVSDYEYLTKKLMDETFEFEYVMSDQGFLNAVYENNWHEIGFLNNANLALYRFQRDFWDEHKLEDIRIIHYTMQKPWRCSAGGAYGPICKVWIDAE